MVERTWFRYRIRENELDPKGGFRKENVFLEGYEIPTDQEGLQSALIAPPFNIMLENTFNCATVRFDYEETVKLIRHGIVAYRVDWDWDAFPNHYTKHTNELYYVFLEPKLVSFDTLEQVLGNKAYDRLSATTVKQVVSHNIIHLTHDGRFQSQPHPIMGTVAAAIGLEQVELFSIERKTGK